MIVSQDDPTPTGVCPANETELRLKGRFRPGSQLFFSEWFSFSPVVGSNPVSRTASQDSWGLINCSI
jgi:hypothetical protein